LEHFHTDDFAGFIEIKDYARRHLFRLDDFRVIQTEIQGVRLGIEMQLHSLSFMVRSKNTLTTRQGAKDVKERGARTMGFLRVG
jgi:hypothetical protein